MKMSTPRYKNPRGPMFVARRVPSKITPEGAFILDQLIAARHAAGMTQTQLAKIMDITPSMVADMERGSHQFGPSITRIVRYARAVGLDTLKMSE